MCTFTLPMLKALKKKFLEKKQKDEEKDAKVKIKKEQKKAPPSTRPSVLISSSCGAGLVCGNKQVMCVSSTG